MNIKLVKFQVILVSDPLESIIPNVEAFFMLWFFLCYDCCTWWYVKIYSVC
jgi:hypothetical protein